MSWYCLHTRPQAETQVASYCRDVLGAEVYYPRLRRHRLVHRRRVIATGPLFPRYLFCRIDEALGFRAIRYAPNVLSVVQRGAEPVAVPDSLIAELQRWAGDLLDETRCDHSWQAGESVRIAEGPLVGFTGVIVHLHDDARVDLLLELLHDGARLTVDSDQLELVRAV